MYELAHMAVAMNAFERSMLGKEKQGMHPVTISAFLDELEKVSADLTPVGREHIKKKNFALPKERKYPIHDLAHARNALARVAQHGTPDQQAAVRSKVHAKYPELGGKEKDAAGMYDAVGAAKPFANVIHQVQAAKKAVSAGGGAVGSAAKAVVHKPGITIPPPKLRARGAGVASPSMVQRANAGTAVHRAPAAPAAAPSAVAAPAQAAGKKPLVKRLAVGGLALGGAGMVGHMMPQHHQPAEQQVY